MSGYQPDSSGEHSIADQLIQLYTERKALQTQQFDAKLVESRGIQKKLDAIDAQIKALKQRQEIK